MAVKPNGGGRRDRHNHKADHAAAMGAVSQVATPDGRVQRVNGRGCRLKDRGKGPPLTLRR